MQALWEHKQLQTEQIVVTTSNAGVSKIEFIEFRSKTVKGGLKKIINPELKHSTVILTIHEMIWIYSYVM